jgi:hypothetical protein
MSGSKNLQTSITADASSLRASLAQAQADVRAYGTEVRKIAGDLRAAGTAADAGMSEGLRKASTSLNTATVSARQLQAELGKKIDAAAGIEAIAPAAQHAATGSSMITRELIVLGHEAMQGRYSRIPGSLMVLAEYSGRARMAIAALAAGFGPVGIAATAAGAVAAGALALITAHAWEAYKALQAVGRLAAGLGQNIASAKAEFEATSTALTRIGVATKDSETYAKGVQHVTAATAAQKRELADVAPFFAKAFGLEPQQAIEELSQALDKGGQGVEGLIRKYDLWDQKTGETQRAQLALAKSMHDGSIAAGVGIDALRTRFAGNLAEVQKYREAVAKPGFLGIFPHDVTQEGITRPPVRPDTAVQGGSAETPAEAARRDVTLEHGKDLLELKGLNLQLGEAEAQRAKAGTAAEREMADAAVKNIQATIAEHRAKGDASWLQNQQAALDEQLLKIAATATSSKKLAEDENRTRVKFWTEAAKQEGLTDQQRLKAQAEATHAALALKKEELSGGGGAARQALETKLATLNEEQEANHDNFAKVMELENQKLELLKAAGAKFTKEYENELRKRDVLEREHRNHVLGMDEEGLAKQREIDSEQIAERRAELDEEVDAHQISKAHELTILKEFIDQKRALEVKSLEDLLKTLDKESDAYTKLLEQLTQVKQKWATEDARINREVAKDQQKSIDDAIAPITDAFDQSMNGMIQGTQTLQQAVARMGQSVVASYAKMAAQSLMHWVGGKLKELLFGKTVEAAKTTDTIAGTHARSAAENSGGILGAIGRKLAQWLGLETSKTAITTTQSAARTTAETSGGFLGAIGSMLARWFGLETAKTGATVAQVGVRTGAETTGAAAAMAATGATNVAEGMSYAAVGGAAAGASVAAIPIVGWAMAPGVAAETYAALGAFASLAALDTGAWNLPRDMTANLHAGEMVVPASFASGLRGGMGGGGTTLNYSPSVSGGNNPDLSSMMRAQSKEFKSYIWQQSRNGNLALRGR